MSTLKFRFSLVFLFVISVCFSQNSNNILCLDFTLNGKKFSRSRELLQAFEGVLAHIENPPVIIEREKLASIIEKIQEEQNLAKDFSGEVLSDLTIAHVDYILYGSFSKVLTSETYDFRFEFVKISGTRVSSKFVSPIIRFTEQELSNSFDFEQKTRAELSKYSFIEGVGIIGAAEYKNIQKQLNEKEEQINELRKMLVDQKNIDDSINLNKHTVPDFNARLIVRNDSIIVQIKPVSDIPFKYDFRITNDTGLYILGPVELVFERPIFFPSEIKKWVDLRTYSFPQFHGIDTSKPFRLIFGVNNESIYFEETGDRKLRREFKAIYLCDFNKKSLTLLPK